MTTLPTILTTSTSVALNVSVFNNTAAVATVACWLDFNRDGDFADTGSVSATTAAANSGQTTKTLTFTGFAAPTAGTSYLRCRLANTAAEVTNATGVANTGEVEDYRVTIVGVDYGDAVDATAGTAQGNYNTRLADNGPSHTIVPDLQLGANAPDGDSGLLQNAAANADDTTNSGVAGRRGRRDDAAGGAHDQPERAAERRRVERHGGRMRRWRAGSTSTATATSWMPASGSARWSPASPACRRSA